MSWSCGFGTHCLPLAVELLWGESGSLLPGGTEWERTSCESGYLSLNRALQCPSGGVPPM